MNRNKVYDYVVVLKNHNIKLISKTSRLMMILSVLPFAASIYFNPKNLLTYLFVFVSAALLISKLVEQQKGKQVSYALLLGVTGLGIFFSTSIPYIGQLYILAGLFDWHFSKNTEVGFSNDVIVKSGLFPKKINWNELNNIVIKDDLLTIDFKNNTLFQAYTDDADNDEYEVGDDEFNAYCREILNR
jgi:hypothetical protein